MSMMNTKTGTSDPTQPKLTTYTVEEAASILRISRGSAYEAVRQGEIPSVKIGRCIRVPRAALEAKLAAVA
jgi:excisionase family DNA binding protein